MINRIFSLSPLCFVWMASNFPDRTLTGTNRQSAQALATGGGCKLRV